MSDDFYLTLPSNTGQNTNSASFRVALPQTIKLVGEWQVALSELIYPNSWYNVVATPAFLMAIETEDDTTTLGIDELRTGHYATVEDVLNAFADSMPTEMKPHVAFNHDKRANRVEISIEKPILNLYLPTPIMYMLGYDVDHRGIATRINKHNGLAAHSPDMRSGIDCLFVYCDIVEHTVVGDRLAPLLRAIAVEGKFGDIISKTFITPHYVPVLKKEFSSLEIAIKTDQNKTLGLQFGKTLVKLHFKRKEKGLFI